MNKHWLKALAGTISLGVIGQPSSSWAIGGKVDYGPDFGCGPDCCTYIVPPYEDSGDDFYHHNNWDWCRQDFLNDTADFWGMNSKHWDDGFGWNDACNMDKPFARTLVSTVAMLTAHPTPATKRNDWDGGILRASYGWASTRTNLRADCYENGVIATSKSGKRVDLHLLSDHPGEDYAMAFFHGHSVPERAAIIVHEARHKKGPGHDSQGRDDSWEQEGAFRYEAEWLRQYASVGNPATTTRDLRCMAQDASNVVMYDAGFFATTPDASLELNLAECR